MCTYYILQFSMYNLMSHMSNNSKKNAILKEHVHTIALMP